MNLRTGFSFALSTLILGACGGGLGEADSPKRPPIADQWVARAIQSYKAGDIEDAKTASDAAVKAAPKDAEARLLRARVSLARLDFAEALRSSEGMQSTEAHQIRGRAFWYQGDLEQAADELDAMLRDPKIKDPWAKEISKLARWGQGRRPFAIEGGLVASVEMPQAGPALVVPCEIEGEQVLALVATGSSELIIDSASRKEPAWVNLRFGQQLEVKDVPALTQDLGPLSRQFGAPIKALLGVNLLRHMHATFDRRGSQFVVRKDEAAPPPDASRIPLFYVRGGGMMMRMGLSIKEEIVSPFLVDSAAFYPIALEDVSWKRTGYDLASLKPEPNLPGNVKSGVLPGLRFGAFDLPGVPAVQGLSIADSRSTLDVDVGGIVGAGLLQLFRVTFADDGRYIWVEPDPTMMGGPGGAPRVPAAGAPPGRPGPAMEPEPDPKAPTSPTSPKGGPSLKPLTPPGAPKAPNPAPAPAPAPAPKPGTKDVPKGLR
jgi:hypothetical protein